MAQQIVLPEAGKEATSPQEAPLQLKPQSPPASPGRNRKRIKAKRKSLPAFVGSKNATEILQFQSSVVNKNNNSNHTTGSPMLEETEQTDDPCSRSFSAFDSPLVSLSKETPQEEPGVEKEEEEEEESLPLNDVSVEKTPETRPEAGSDEAPLDTKPRRSCSPGKNRKKIKAKRKSMPAVVGNNNKNVDKQSLALANDSNHTAGTIEETEHTEDVSSHSLRAVDASPDLGAADTKENTPEDSLPLNDVPAETTTGNGVAALETRPQPRRSRSPGKNRKKIKAKRKSMPAHIGKSNKADALSGNHSNHSAGTIEETEHTEDVSSSSLRAVDDSPVLEGTKETPTEQPAAETQTEESEESLPLNDVLPEDGNVAARETAKPQPRRSCSPGRNRSKVKAKRKSVPVSMGSTKTDKALSSDSNHTTGTIEETEHTEDVSSHSLQALDTSPALSISKKTPLEQQPTAATKTEASEESLPLNDVLPEDGNVAAKETAKPQPRRSCSPGRNRSKVKAKRKSVPVCIGSTKADKTLSSNSNHTTGTLEETEHTEDVSSRSLQALDSSPALSISKKTPLEQQPTAATKTGEAEESLPLNDVLPEDGNVAAKEAAKPQPRRSCSPGRNRNKVKAKRKSVPVSTGSTKTDRALSSNSNHTTGTLEETEHTEDVSSRSLRVVDSSPTLSISKKTPLEQKPAVETDTEEAEESLPLNDKPKAKTTSKKKERRRSTGNLKEKRRSVRAKSLDAAEGEQARKIVQARLAEKENLRHTSDHNAASSSAAEEATTAIKKSSTLANQSSEAIPKSSTRSNQSDDAAEARHAPTEERESRSAHTRTSNSTEGKRRARRTSPRPGAVPKFLQSDVSLSGKEAPEGAAAADTQPRSLQQPEQKIDEEGQFVYYEEELVSAPAPAKGGEAPNTPSSVPKKSILKAAESEPTAVRPSLINPAPDLNYTLVIPSESKRDVLADDVTCLTMDDFEAKAKQQRTFSRVKRLGKLKRASSKESEDSSKDPVSRSSSGLSDAGLAEILRKDIHSKKEPVLIASLDAIQEFAGKGSKQRNKVCAFGAIPSILHIMDNKKTTRTVLLSALGAFEKVTAKVSKNQATACELGAIPTIAMAMQRHFAIEEVVLAACKTLEMITSCLRLSGPEDAEQDKYEDVSMHGAMTVLSCCLMTHPKHKDILAHAVGAITNLCRYRQDQMQIFCDSGGIPVMTAVLKKKWKSKTRKTQAMVDLALIVASVQGVNDEEEPSESLSTHDNDEEEEDDDDESVVGSFASG